MKISLEKNICVFVTTIKFQLQQKLDTKLRGLNLVTRGDPSEKGSRPEGRLQQCPCASWCVYQTSQSKNGGLQCELLLCCTVLRF